MSGVMVVKLDTTGREVFRYAGTVQARGDGWLQLEAPFLRASFVFHGVPFGKGDRFVEVFYTDRWYNIIEMHAAADDHLTGWYCNVTRPAQVVGDEIRYVDLALDLLVYPDGQQLVLDEDEFDALELGEHDTRQARAALAELQAAFAFPLTWRVEGGGPPRAVAPQSHEGHEGFSTD